MSLATDFVIALNANATITANFEAVQHAWFMEPIENIADLVPALFVFPGKHTVAGNEFDGFVAQYTAKQLQVYVVTDISVIDERIEDLRAVALGWQWTAAHDETEFVSGEPMSIKGATIWWLETYISRVQIRQS